MTTHAYESDESLGVFVVQNTPPQAGVGTTMARRWLLVVDHTVSFLMTTYIIAALITLSWLASGAVASAQVSLAQVSSGDPAAADQNAAKHSTDNAGQDGAAKTSRETPGASHN